jgi:hypothetical protein
VYDVEFPVPLRAGAVADFVHVEPFVDVYTLNPASIDDLSVQVSFTESSDCTDALSDVGVDGLDVGAGDVGGGGVVVPPYVVPVSVLLADDTLPAASTARTV